MKKIFFSILILNITIAGSFCLSMDITTNTSEVSISPKIELLSTIYDQIKKYKDSEPEKYLSDMNRLANILYAVTFPREELFLLHKEYLTCKKTEEYAIFNGTYVNGCKYAIYEKLTPILPSISTHLGNLIDFETHDGRKELCIYATSPKQRAFAKKITSNADTLTRDKCIKYLNKYRNDEDPAIKVLANNYTYLHSNQQLLYHATKLILLKSLLNSEEINNFCATLCLKKLFLQENTLLTLTKIVWNKAEETPPSIIEKLQPMCSSSVFDTMITEDPHLLAWYKTIIQELQTNLTAYALKQLPARHKKPAEFKKFLTPLRTKYLHIAPELQIIFTHYGLSGELPGITPLEIPQALTEKPKTTPSLSSKKRGRSRRVGAKQKQKNTEPIQNSLPQKELSNAKPITNSEVRQPTFNNIIEQNNLTECMVIYDNRVLLQNNNKNDPYHGFTLITIPFILKHGIHKTWSNKKTKHADDLFEIYGEIEYHKTQEIKFVKFVLCRGADNAIYHIQMSTIDSDEKNNLSDAQYNIEFPPLGTIVNTPKNSTHDEYGSTIIAETDYMVQVNDGGLNATITLYK